MVVSRLVTLTDPSDPESHRSLQPRQTTSTAMAEESQACKDIFSLSCCYCVITLQIWLSFTEIMQLLSKKKCWQYKTKPALTWTKQPPDCKFCEEARSLIEARITSSNSHCICSVVTLLWQTALNPVSSKFLYKGINPVLWKMLFVKIMKIHVYNCFRTLWQCYTVSVI